MVRSGLTTLVLRVSIVVLQVVKVGPNGKRDHFYYRHSAMVLGQSFTERIAGDDDEGSQDMNRSEEPLW